ncbi:MAG: response regulator [Pseudomonadota bacterium]
MSVVSIFAGTHCAGRQVAQAVAQGLGCPLLDDAWLLERVAWRPSQEQAPPAPAIFEHLELFDPFPGQRDRLLGRLRLAMSSLLDQDNLVYLGQGAHLIPPAVSHILSVCLIADFRDRLGRAMRDEGLGQGVAEARLKQADQQAMGWVALLHGREAWSSDLYDILVPMDRMDVEGTVGLILEHARSVLLLPTTASLQAVQDFALAARLETALADQGHPTRDLLLEVEQERLTITTKGGVVMTDGQERDIRDQAARVEGVDPQRLEVRVARQGQPAPLDTEPAGPAKIFLVDDEREFVQTLSERLQMRQINSAVVYNGQQALQLARENEPEVMVLDLKMPGMDGMEVLRRIKKDHPAVEVIILTGHGSDQELQMCLELGAFAFLKKPVDVETLQETLAQAYEKIKARRG